MNEGILAFKREITENVRLERKEECINKKECEGNWKKNIQIYWI